MTAEAGAALSRDGTEVLSHESLQPDIKHMTAAANEELLAATDDGDISRALAAVAAGASLTAALTAGGSNALHNAAFEGHAQLCVALIDAGAAVEARRRDGVTALEIAARNGHSETVRTLSLVAAAASDAAKVQATSRTDAAAGSAASTARPTPPPPAGSASASSSRIPVVDWRRAETDREGFLADILHALSEVGFMCLTEHPHFDAEIQARTMAQAHRFFDAPAEIQATASIANTPHFRGHAPPAYTPSQLSELFMYGPAAQKPRADYTDEDVPAWQRIFYGPNTWPGGNFLFRKFEACCLLSCNWSDFPRHAQDSAVETASVRTGQATTLHLNKAHLWAFLGFGLRLRATANGILASTMRLESSSATLSAPPRVRNDTTRSGRIDQDKLQIDITQRSRCRSQPAGERDPILSSFSQSTERASEVRLLVIYSQDPVGRGTPLLVLRGVRPDLRQGQPNRSGFPRYATNAFPVIPFSWPATVDRFAKTGSEQVTGRLETNRSVCLFVCLFVCFALRAEFLTVPDRSARAVEV